MGRLKVEGKDGLYRDSSSRAIINTNQTDYQNYMNARNRLKSEKERVDQLEEKVDGIKGDLDEIKSLLRSLTFDPTVRTPYGVNLTMYTGADFEETFKILNNDRSNYDLSSHTMYSRMTKTVAIGSSR